MFIDYARLSITSQIHYTIMCMQKRPYRMRARAERQAETRRRIVEAAVELHSSIGPAKTSISAVAERAGVQRNTFYAHFAGEEELFRACTLHWRAAHPFPASSSWDAIEDPLRRLRRALREVYAWYAAVEPEFALFVRDSYLFPAFWKERTDAMDELVRRLVAPFGRGRLVRAVVGHAVDFETWRSLVRRQGLSQEQAVAAMVELVASLRS
jgi:AcrR family transcriptional regulator